MLIGSVWYTYKIRIAHYNRYETGYGVTRMGHVTLFNLDLNLGELVFRHPSNVGIFKSSILPSVFQSAF